MKKEILIFILAIIGIYLQGQILSKTESDSSYITVQYVKNSDTYFHTNILNDIPLCYCIEYYSDHETLKRKGRRYADYSIGRWDYFTKKAVKYMTIDYDNNTRVFFNDTSFVFKKDWQHVKQKADSIVLSYYSKEFFVTHIKLNVSQTTWDSKDNKNYYSGTWFELFRDKPFRYNMVYNIMLSQNVGFSHIKFELDENGNLIDTWRNEGFQKVEKCCFNITPEEIEELILKLELGNNLEWALEWNESIQDLEIRVTNSMFFSEPEESRLKTKSVYINPWSGEFSEVEESK